MQLQVIYRDRNGQLSRRRFNLTKSAFIKHMAIAGMRYAPCLHKLRRIIGVFFLYSDYLRDFQMSRFSEPIIMDPTEKAKFSNLAGKAIADYLSKKINHSRFTIAYEHAMKERGIPIQGPRPDLIAFGINSVFAIEAKGSSDDNVSDNEMNKYKQQAQSGPIKVNFAVVSVSYNLYKLVRCKYYDPPMEDDFRQDGEELLRKLSKRYYTGLKEFIRRDFFDITEVEFNKEEFFILKPKKHFLPLYECWKGDCPLYQWNLILSADIEKFAKEGISKKTEPFETIEEENLYIDVDRVGLKLW